MLKKFASWSCRTMDWYPILEPEILLDGEHGIDRTGPLKWPRKYGLRFSSTLLRTMSCLKASSSSPACSLLESWQVTCNCYAFADLVQ
jgi:hypothetical protein